MKDVQRARTKHFVEDGRVAQRGAEDGFEDQTKVHEVVTHALFKDGQLASLGDHQIGPLDDDNRDEVRGLRVLESGGLVVDVRLRLRSAVPPVVRARRSDGFIVDVPSGESPAGRGTAQVVNTVSLARVRAEIRVRGLLGSRKRCRCQRRARSAARETFAAESILVEFEERIHAGFRV